MPIKLQNATQKGGETMASIKTQVRNWDFLPVMLSQDYLAGLMGITIPEVTRYCRLGKIPGAKKVGKYWFVEKSVLRNYMEGQAND